MIQNKIQKNGAINHIKIIKTLHNTIKDKKIIKETINNFKITSIKLYIIIIISFHIGCILFFFKSNVRVKFFDIFFCFLFFSYLN